MLVNCGRSSESEKNVNKKMARKKWLFDISKITYTKHGIKISSKSKQFHK